MSRAMTLIELLLALALLGVLMTVGVSWITTSSRLASEQGDRLQWRRSADALLRCIRHDLAIGDFDPARDVSERTRRVQVHDGTLSIRTRERGEEHRRLYRFDPGAGIIRSWTDNPDARISPIAPPASSTVLARVSGFEALINEKHTTLNVTIYPIEGQPLHRTYGIGEVP